MSDEGLMIHYDKWQAIKNSERAVLAQEVLLVVPYTNAFEYISCEESSIVVLLQVLRRIQGALW